MGVPRAAAQGGEDDHFPDNALYGGGCAGVAHSHHGCGSFKRIRNPVFAEGEIREGSAQAVFAFARVGGAACGAAGCIQEERGLFRGGCPGEHGGACGSRQCAGADRRVRDGAGFHGRCFFECDGKEAGGLR